MCLRTISMAFESTRLPTARGRSQFNEMNSQRGQNVCGPPLDCSRVPVHAVYLDERCALVLSRPAVRSDFGENPKRTDYWPQTAALNAPKSEEAKRRHASWREAQPRGSARAGPRRV